MISTLDYDVAIVGVGPVGGVLANLLGLQGVRTVAIDRSLQAVQLPRGVALVGEIMRVVQTMGLAETLEPLMRVFPGTQYLDYDGNVVATRPAVPPVGPQGWADSYLMHQPDVEQVFRQGICSHPSVERRYGVEVDEVRADRAAGVVSMTDVETGERSTISARYVVGCDGASSKVRKAAQLPLDDFGLNEPWVVVDLAVDESVDLPEVNTHYADPDQPVIYVNVVRDQRRYEFRMASETDLEKYLEPEEIWRLVSRWVTPMHAALVRAAVYTHRSLVAEQWRNGPLIVAGDAAHQTPPFMGQGLCAGVRDAASLAWRLAAVVRDGADDALVDSYCSERSAHAAFIIRAATELGKLYKSPDRKRINEINASIGRDGRGTPPRLGRGLWLDGGPGGTLAPQPRLADGRLLDDAIGYHFGVIASIGLLDDLPAATRQLAKAAGFGFVEADGDVAAWLAELGTAAVVLRPDRYYYGSFDGVGALGAAIRRLAETVAPAATA